MIKTTKQLTFTNNSNVFVQDSTERHRDDIEVSVFGEPVKGVRLIAGASYIHGTEEDTGSAASEGKMPIGVPTMLFNVNAEYDVPLLQGLTLTAWSIHTGSQYFNTTNTLSIPAWGRFDLGSRYATVVFGKPTTFRASVLNVANKSYWESTIGGYLTQGGTADGVVVDDHGFLIFLWLKAPTAITTRKQRRFARKKPLKKAPRRNPSSA